MRGSDQFLEGEVLNKDDKPKDENASLPLVERVAGAAVSAASSAASAVANAAKDAFAATLEAPASEEQHQCICLTVERPGPLQL